ncbi:MAG: HlyD family efflux transporter periplasmic adaptor subunit [Brachymonas sp.]|nr:HlyD family efflux transporter periplasmic adaptor subunit [Brachymonas sp.]
MLSFRLIEHPRERVLALACNADTATQAAQASDISKAAHPNLLSISEHSALISCRLTAQNASNYIDILSAQEDQEPRQQASQETAKASQREQLTTLRAPVAGQVQQLAIHTAGGIATEAQVLMVIVPQEAQVTAEVVLDNKDIGFVQQGQSVAIKLVTFPFTRYGTLPAQVQHVSADAVIRDKRGEGGSAETAIFPATLKLQATHIDIDGKQVRLSPGMNLTAEIKTGQRRVIEYLLSPIQKAGSESLRER